MGALRFAGKVRDFRTAMNRLRRVPITGYLGTDEVGRRRYQRELARAALRSWVRQTLAGRWGGDAA